MEKKAFFAQDRILPKLGCPFLALFSPGYCGVVPVDPAYCGLLLQTHSVMRSMEKGIAAKAWQKGNNKHSNTKKLIAIGEEIHVGGLICDPLWGV